jgi:hypothetical protein
MSLQSETIVGEVHVPASEVKDELNANVARREQLKPN